MTTKNFFIILTILLLTISAWLAFESWSFLNTPLVAKNGSPVTFVFSKGSSIKKAADSLKTQKLLRYPLVFVLFVRLSGVDHQLQAGEYNIQPGMTPRELAQKMVRGEVVQYYFTLVEGWTFKQFIAALNDNQYIAHAVKKLIPEEVMEKIGHVGEFPEGRFAPDTYQFSRGVADVDILINAYNLMQIWLQEAWTNRDLKVPYKCPYEALIVASLIEKETATREEKPIIAGVILRRLKAGIPLQIDPTVIYGLGENFTGKLSKADLKKKTSYNTYSYRGLPPTPIAMPGKDSIIAALHPVDTNFLYYVSKGDGTHEFSATLNEQQQAIKKYLLKK